MTRLLVTVGSTLFTALTDAVLSDPFLAFARCAGISRLVVQAGKAPLGDFVLGDQVNHIPITILRYTVDAAEMETLIAQSDIVISHAGSGTILAVLRRPSPPRLLVVPNPALMDNHQQELADALAAQGFLSVCDVGSLADGVSRVLDPTTPAPVPFPPFQPGRFAAILDEVAGVA